MGKICTSCGDKKPLSKYQTRSLSKDGVTASCKDCLKKRDARRFQDDPRVKARHLAYQSTDHGKASMIAAKKKWANENKEIAKATRLVWLEKNPEKRAAHLILASAVLRGLVNKPNECSKCGAGGRIDGHHHDYTRPIDVTWLCRQCHVSEHKALREAI
jgi:ribosomal protein S27AE